MFISAAEFQARTAVERTGQFPMYSHLLLIRVWPEEVGEGMVEWRGRLQSLHSGDALYFRDGPTLYAALLRILDDLEADQHDAQAPPTGDATASSAADVETDAG